VIVIDANILLYAYDSASLDHEAARNWLEDALAGYEAVGLSWVTLLAFLRISTNPRARKDPYSLAEANAIVSQWLDRAIASVVHPGERHWEILKDLLVEGQASGRLVTDAHLAALAIEHGATLCSTDRDFTRFPGLRLLNPLKPPSRKR
jgi:toxin-antitoxin system PIN domain toxin